jgi:hypothetical protein
VIKQDWNMRADGDCINNEMSSMSTNCANDFAHGNFWNIGEKGQTAIADAKMRRFWLCNKTRRK